MKESNELLELCKQVHEATRWDDTEKYYEERFVNGELYALDICKNAGYKDDGKEFSTGGDVVIRNHTPLYTSDYLLEKLPRTVKFYGDSASMSCSGYSYLSIERPVTSNWCASYRYEGYQIHCGFGDTPLEALLELTIALHEEKIL